MAAMKKEMGMKGNICSYPHHSIFRWAILIIGIFYLFNDLGWWMLWNIQWYTVAFLIIGLTGGCKCCGRGWC